MQLPHWPIARRLRRQPQLRGKPVVVSALTKQRLEVVDRSGEASARGIRIGMTMAEARVLCPALLGVDHEPHVDARALEALGRWMTRFTPDVATRWADPPKKTAQKNARFRTAPTGRLPTLLLLNVTGCDRLFGSVDAIAAQVAAALVRFAIPARLAVAPTPAAAWALAASSSINKKAQPVRVIEQHDLPEAVAPLPVAALRIEPEAVRTLHNLGICTIGQLMTLPRAALPSRFGATLLLRLDQLSGARPEPLTWLGCHTPIETAMTFETAVESLETLWLVLHELLGRVVAVMARRGVGARRVELAIGIDSSLHQAQKNVTRTIHLSRPTRSVSTLLGLLRCATERLDCENGFMHVRLSVPAHERLHTEQLDLVETKEHAGAVEFDRLIERLRVRLGEDVVVFPTLTASRVPERAWRPCAPGEPHAPGKEADAVFAPRTGVRPLHLLPQPAEVRVLAEPSDDSDGKPAQFAYAGRVHRLIHVIGPERIAGEWWRGHHRTRDYYDVDNEAGERFWIFRVATLITECTATVRWFLHGLFQ